MQVYLVGGALRDELLGRAVRERDWVVVGAKPEADALRKELKRRGFRFVGKTICYAFMQAVGIVNDHATGCFRRRRV